MLHGLKTEEPTNLQAMLITMDQYGPDFYLTGSRFFENVSPHSDYDFFCADTKLVREWLDINGFCPVSAEKVRENYLGDSIVTEIWRRSFSDNTIDIQLTTNLALKIKANDFIKRFYTLLDFESLNKSERKTLWSKVVKELT